MSRAIVLLCLGIGGYACSAPAKAPSEGDADQSVEQAQPPASTPPADSPDDDLMPRQEWTDRYGALLGNHVLWRAGKVDYRGLAHHRKEVATLASALTPPRAFGDGRERLAFLVNAYNLLVIHNVLRHGANKSPLATRGFFDREEFAVLGSTLTLERLRDELIRPMGDPRVHMALCDAAAGSPPLRPEPYDSARLDEQLDDQARRFVNDRVRNAAVGGLALISPIFERFAEDFAAEHYGSVHGFLRWYAHEGTPLGRLLRRNPTPPLEYQEFNWALNAP